MLLLLSLTSIVLCSSSFVPRLAQTHLISQDLQRMIGPCLRDRHVTMSTLTVTRKYVVVTISETTELNLVSSCYAPVSLLGVFSPASQCEA